MNPSIQQGKATPYTFTRHGIGDWHIYYGRSKFLVATGSGWSVRIGMELYRKLEADFWKRRPLNRKRLMGI